MRIEASAVSVRAGSRDILRAVDLAAGGGELIGLVGPNGAGKSTLLRVLAGVQKPDVGEVTYDGKGVNTLAAENRARAASFLAQDHTVFWPMRAESLVSLGRLPHHRASPAENAAAVRRALAATQTEDLAERAVDTLSGGELARILLARALAVETPVLLADEPVAALDPYHQIQIMEMLRNSATDGRAVIVVMHDLTLAHRFSDRIVLLSNGSKVADGAPDAVLTNANLAEHFGITARRVQGCIIPWERAAGRHQRAI